MAVEHIQENWMTKVILSLLQIIYKFHNHKIHKNFCKYSTIAQKFVTSLEFLKNQSYLKNINQ